MRLHLKRPLIIFDLESTGISIQLDRIVEISYIKLMPDGSQATSTLLIHPEMPIPAQATAIHGITDADVAGKPTFKEVAARLAKDFEGCDIGGYNSNKFDFPMLVEEFLRAGYEFDTDNRKFIDAQRIFHMMEQRTLSAAYKFYCNKELENAHRAESDSKATLEVLMAQLDRYPQLQNDIDFLHEFTGQKNQVDLAGRLIRNDKNEVVFNFGKHRHKKVIDIFRVEPSYYKWMMEGDFSRDTKRRITQLYIEATQK
jgi:DNA polymerase-3 subunit epsilon